MLPIRPFSITLTQQAATAKLRSHAHELMTVLASRLTELEGTANRAERFDSYAIDQYDSFKKYFLTLRNQCAEFQALSHITHDAISKLELCGNDQWPDCSAMLADFHKTQVRLLNIVVSANLRLLKVWEDRLTQGEGLPFGTHEMFMETVHTIHLVREELLRPRYLLLLEDQALEDAEQTEQLLRKLVIHAPALFDFGGKMARKADPWTKIDDFFVKLSRRH
jgi:hypothetical protein